MATETKKPASIIIAAAKQFIGVKVIRAVPMNRQEYNDLRGWVVPYDENPADEGYLVEYLNSPNKNCEGFDNYVSWSPEAQFVDAYRECDGLTWGLALEAMKKGFKVARKGWNGSGMFAYYVPENRYPAQTDAIKGHFPDDMIPYRAYMALKTAQNDVAQWTPSTSDNLAEDWYVVE